MTIAYLECFSGISGDMFLGALVDAGVPIDFLQQSVDSLHIGVTLRATKTDRSGISASKVDVLVNGETADAQVRHQHAPEERHQHTHSHIDEHGVVTTHTHTHTRDNGHSHTHARSRSLSSIRSLIESVRLTPETKTTAIRAFELLGHSEAKIHNVPVEQIDFHEVGAADAIADIVAVSAGCEFLNVSKWFCSPLNVGSGSALCAHGTFPVPAPATLDLLRGAPVYSAGPKTELVTPTGAALLRALEVQFDSLPVIKPYRIGYGAGTKDFPQFPNVARLTLANVVTDPLAVASSEIPTEITAVIETTIDDTNPQVIAYVAEMLLAEGAAEVFRVPIQMKKGRTGVLMTVLCAPELAGKLRTILFRETSTIGLRYREERKFVLEREFATVRTQWGPVQVKIARLASGEISNASPEYEDCKRLAEQHGVPLKEVLQEASSHFADRSDPTAQGINESKT